MLEDWFSYAILIPLIRLTSVDTEIVKDQFSLHLRSVNV